MIQRSQYKSASMTSLIAEGSLLGLHSLGAHAVQNVLSDGALRYSPPTHKVLQHAFHAGLVGANPSKTMQIATGLHSVATPEVGILSKEMQHLGSSFETALNKHNLSYHTLNPEQHSYLQAAAKGDETLLHKYNKEDPTRYASLRLAIMHTAHPELQPVKDILEHSDKNPEYASTLAKKYRETSFSKFVPKALEPLAKPLQTSKSNLGIIGEGLGNVALSYADPITAGANVIKRVSFSKQLGTVHPMIATAQKKFTDWAFTEALKNIHNTATDLPTAKQTIMRKYFFNPVYGDAATMSQVSGIAKKKGVDTTIHYPNN